MRDRDIRFVIERHMLTEKATLASERSQVMFRVAHNATKPQIKEAVEKLFNVKVKDVRTAVYAGKKSVAMNKSGRYSGFRSSWKKAYVTLAEGQNIEAFDIA